MIVLKFLMPKSIIFRKVLLKTITSSSMEKTFTTNQFEEIRKLTTGLGEYYTTGFFLDYEYIKNHYELIAVDLSSQKELVENPKAIQQIEFAREFKKHCWCKC